MNKVKQAAVLLRADASPSLGIGHVKRCLALGESLRRVGFRPILVTRSLGVDSVALAHAVGIEGRWMGRDGSAITASADSTLMPSWDLDASQTCDALADDEAEWVVVDHYNLDARWHRMVAQSGKWRVAAIDDLANRDLAVELLIDHNLAATDHRTKYATRLLAQSKLLGGPRFALLGEVYADAPRHEVNCEVRSIGIFLGGTDAAGLNKVALAAVCDLAAFIGTVEIVTTRANPRWRDVQQLAARWPNVKVLLDQPDLSAFFARHDLHIGAGGGANWERCCVGGPTVALVVAQNQLAVVPLLQRLGAVAALPPDARNDAPALAREVLRLMDDLPRRRALVHSARALVDGRGAQRVALAMGAERVQVRKVTPADSWRIHQWRNAPETRLVSVHPDEITPPAHEQWLQRTLADPSRLLLMGHIGAVPVGVLRVDALESGALEVSLYLDPALHGLGLGGHLLAEGEWAAREWTRTRGEAASFVATVLPHNVASLRMFVHAGYHFNGNHGLKVVTPVPSTNPRPLP